MALAPNRNITFPAADNINWKDLTYRSGLSYDLFGTGKTALKFSFNKYLLGQTLNGLGREPNPAIVAGAVAPTRTWTDANRDFVPQCDLVNLPANGECAQASNLGFRLGGPDGAVRPGSHHRLQPPPDQLGDVGQRRARADAARRHRRRLLPPLVGELPRDRQPGAHAGRLHARSTSSTPSTPRLGADSGATVRGFVDVVPTKFGQVNNYNTLSTKIGDQTEVWQGVDFTINARLQNGLNLQGGVSTGSTHENDCDILTALPEMRNLAAIARRQPAGLAASAAVLRPQSPYLTQAKIFGVYIIPKMEVQVSGTFRSVPGQIQGSIAENFANVALVATNAFLATNSTLGRPLAGERAERDAADSGAAGALPRPPQRARSPGRQAAAGGPAPGARQHRLLQRAQFQCRRQRQSGLEPGRDRRRTGVLLAADGDPERADDEVHGHV